MENILGILEEPDEGQDHRFYVYNFEHEEVCSWFDTYAQAEQYIADVNRIMKQ